MVRHSLILAAGFLLAACVTTGDPAPASQSQPRCVSGDCVGGVGERHAPDGARYTGAFHEGRPHGQGTLTGHDGTVIQGQWLNGEAHGPGRLVSDELVYEGGFSGGRFHGEGRLVRADGTVESGRFADGALREGRVEFSAGEVLEGTFTEGAEAVFADGNLTAQDATYSGRFRLKAQETPWGRVIDSDTQPVGEHQVVHADGAREEVRFVNGVLHGRAWRVEADGVTDSVAHWEEGVLVFDAPGPKAIAARRDDASCVLDGTRQWVYFGDACRNGLAHGEGLAARDDGSALVEGRFEDGRFVEGVMHRRDGSRLAGQWRAFVLHGQGSTYEDGDLVYRGEFRQGQRHGEGFCADRANLVPCEFYEGQRMDQAYVMDQAREQAHREAVAARDAARSARAALDGASRTIDSSWDSRHWRMERDVQRRRDQARTDAIMAQRREAWVQQEQQRQERSRQHMAALQAHQDAAVEARRQQERERQAREQEAAQRAQAQREQLRAQIAANHERAAQQDRVRAPERVAAQSPSSGQTASGSSAGPSGDGAASRERQRVYEPMPQVVVGTTDTWWPDRDSAIAYARLSAANEINSICRRRGARTESLTFAQVEQGIAPGRWNYDNPNCKEQTGRGSTRWKCEAKVSKQCYRMQ
ncbi:hypothetical protein B1C78_13100 [Thioalkalivibrio denitrificans]|uniref:Uncharacterized protein n=1 Tax=Thioalkalivibrio denitrificans TaxID=108003 RepID=A0A1V3ND10_9GAMM|nr:hypothetical protein [Thioalkalivibrio denitrificans]OOG22987.1 hypothetical protein B1C78_13100 [Thioalkalivibrio denitrificans]